MANGSSWNKLEDVDLGDSEDPPQLRQRIAHAAHNPDAAFAQRRRSSILVGQRSLDLMAMEDPGSTGPRFVRLI